MITNDTPFRPVTGSEKTILNQQISPGHVYFAHDTGKIFLDVDEETRTSMGGSGVSLFYGKSTNVIEQADSTYKILIADLEDSTTSPKEDDLILNSDGTFYRVSYIANGSLYCHIIAVSGTGGGGTGGGGTSGGGGISSSITLTLTGKVPTQFVYGQSVNITHTVAAVGDDTVSLVYTIINSYGDATSQQTYSYKVNNGASHTFDVGSKLKIGTNSITVTATGNDTDNTTYKKYSNRACIEMDLKESSDFNPLNVFSEAISFYCIPTGGSSDFSQNLKIYIDNILQSSLTKTGITDSGRQIGITIPPQSHGKHILKAVLTDESETVEKSLTYEIACAEDGIDLPIIWTTNLPSSIVNHNPMDIQYRVYDPRMASGKTQIGRALNGVTLSNFEVACTATSSSWSVWRVTGYTVGINNISIECGDTSYPIQVKVEKDSRELDILTSGLLVSLDAEGRSLNENKTDRQTWEYTNSSGKKTSVVFKDFNWYNNGWKTDDEGKTCLRISNGASVQIPLQAFQKKELTSAYTFEFVFKLHNIQNYNALIKTESTGEFDSEGNEKFKKVITSTDGVWLNYYNNHVGFCLGTQECFFTSRNTTVSARYKEDELIHLSFVVEKNSGTSLIYIYVNGIASGVEKYVADGDDFNNNNLANMIINSEYCDVDLYKFRAYTVNLTAENIVHNYIADYVDAQMYDANQICTYSNGIPTIDYDKMVEYNKNNPENLLMPYMIIESPDGILPYYKDETGDGRENFAITFKNPSLDRDWDNGVINGLFDTTNSSTYDAVIAAKWGTAENYYLHHVPSFNCSTGVYLNVQGTSSQGYPRRNYKAKFKDAGSNGYWTYTNGPVAGKKINKDKDAAGKKYGMYLDSNVAETSFCFKADYMESSRSHNTGFANFVDTFYSKHPLKDYGISDASNYRTAIYGFPMMVFHKFGEKIEFIGLYNFNLDKSCKDSFGFTSTAASKVKKIVKATTDTTYNVTKTYYSMNDEKTLLTFASKFKDGVTYYEETDTEAANTFTLPVDLASAAECWQIEHNRGGNCSFMGADFTSVSEDDKYAGVLKAAAEDFEVRYHSDKDNIEYAIERSHGFSGFDVETAVNPYLKKRMSNLEKMVAWVASTDTTAVLAEPPALDEPYEFGGKTYLVDNAEYRLAKFSKEFEEHFDLEYAVIYFVATEIMLCYDSRGKNCMLATWGPQKDGGEYIWYPIFYDIDTQLGINNSGVPYWDYYEEATNNNTFSTPNSVLWNNLWKTKSTYILEKYNSLRGTQMTLDVINGYYDFNPSVTGSYAMKGNRPIIALNVDEYFKYIDPAIGKGYYDTGNEIQHSDTFFYCLQGTRKLQRELFLRNRFNYMDSMWLAGTYSKTGIKMQVSMRFDANYYPDTSDKWLDKESLTEDEISKGFEIAPFGQNALDTNLAFNITPYLKQYLHMQVDDTKTSTKKAEAGTYLEVNAPTSLVEEIKSTMQMQQQLIYFGGIDYLSSLGDLSLKYLDQFQLTGGGKRLKDLILGNDTPGYFNKKLVNGSAFALNDSATNSDGTENQSAKRLMETIVLTNLQGLGGVVDLSGSEKLKTLRALGTQITSFKFAEGVQLETAYLPATVTNLALTEPVALSNILSDASSYLEDKITYTRVEDIEDTWSEGTYYIIDINADEGYSIDNGTEYNPTLAYFTRNVSQVTKYHKGLFIEGLTDKNIINQLDTTNILTLNIIGGNMGYDSYKLLEKLTNIKLAMINNQTLNNDEYSRKLYVNLENFNWSPFTLVEVGEAYNSSKTYKKRTDHYTIVNYNYTDATTWTKDVLNGYVYEYDDAIFQANRNVLTNLDVLDTYITDYLGENDGHYTSVVEINEDQTQTIISDSSYNWFESINTYTDNRRSVPYLSGIMYINNDAEHPIRESDIKNKYIDTYWNDLTIYAANVEESYIAKFISVNDDGLETELYIQKFEKSGGQYPSNINNGTGLDVPSKIHYDFVGWKDQDGNMVPKLSTTDESGKMMFDFSGYVFTNLKSIYTFTAVFEVHKQNITYMAGKNLAAMQSVAVKQITYNTVIPDPLLVASLDESDIEQEDFSMRYRFLGWTTNSEKVIVNNASDAEFVVFNSSLIATGDKTFYAVFSIESAKSSASDSSYFKFKSDSKYSGGCVVSPANGVKLSGKITIPTVSPDGLPVTTISGFSSQKNITAIYWYGEPHLKEIADDCFRANNTLATDANRTLKIFEFPSTLKIIGSYAFQHCKALTSSDFSNCTQLETVCEYAFYGAYQPSRAWTLKLPGSLNTLKTQSFAYINNTVEGIILNVIIGSSEAPTMLTQANFSKDSFQTNSGMSIQTLTLYYYKSNSTIADVFTSLSLENDTSSNPYYTYRILDLQQIDDIT